MGRRKTACLTCTIIKAKCTEGQPCRRCERLSLTCQYDERSSQIIHDPSVDKKRRKVYHSRSTDGCITCRRKHVKCDEKQPTCGLCERLHISCERVHPRQQRSSPTSPTNSPLDVEHQPSGLSSSKASTGGLPATTTSPPALSGPDYPFHSTSARFQDWIALLSHDTNNEWVKPSHLAKSVAQVDYPTPCLGNDNVGLAHSHPPAALNRLTGITSSKLASWSIAEKHLLNHFLQSVSRALVVVRDEENPFLRGVVPLALDHAGVRNALLALSACHLSYVYPDWKKDVLNHRSLALTCLKEEMEAMDSVTKVLCTTLLLCILEICEGHSRIWLLHLHGANALLNTVSSTFMAQSPMAELCDLYRHISCFASLTSDNVPPTLDIPPPPRAYSHSRNVLHPLYGVSEDLLFALERINGLEKIGIQSPSRCFDVNFVQESLEIEQILRNWVPSDEAAPSRITAEANSAAVATKWALILLLRQTVTNSYELSVNHWSIDNELKEATENILSALTLIRPGSEIESQTLFPLFMAGLGSMTKANRLTVEYRLSIMEATVGFGNISVAHRLLDEIWRRLNNDEVVDWKSLLREEYPSLVLF